MAENRNAQQVREITDKLEQGIKELFESERFKEYLRTMSKFYNYSFNNTLLIAMQKPEATYVAGYTSWQRNFDRQVMKGEKGIKILAPAPYKAQEEREKIDPLTQKPVIGADGKAVTETVEVLRPAFKVVSVFDVSQTDGKERPIVYIDFDALHDSYMKATSSMHKAYEMLIEHYNVYIVAPAPTNDHEYMAKVQTWVEEYLSTPAYNHIIFCNQKNLLYGDYFIDPSPCDGFMGTTIEYGSDEFKTFEEIITFFERLGGQ